MRKLLLFLITPALLSAAISANTVWEVRTTGADTNGGGFVAGASGTDYSQQDAAQFSGTNLASTSGTTNPCVVTSATHNFVATDVGNIIQITAGTNWTTGFYQIVSVATNAATLDRACGSSATLSSGTWAVGGALATPGKAGAAHVGGNVIWVKSGTYSISSSTVNTAGGPPNLAGGATATYTRIQGYTSSRGDFSTRPIFQATVANPWLIDAWTGSPTKVIISNLDLDCNSKSSTRALMALGAQSIVYRVHAHGCDTTGILAQDANSVVVYSSATGNAVAGGAIQGGGSVLYSEAYANTGPGIVLVGRGMAIGNLSYGNTGGSSHGFVFSGNYINASENTAYGNGGDCFNVTADSVGTLANNIAQGCSGYGFNASAATNGLLLINNAVYNNTTANINTTNITSTQIGTVTGSGSFFTNAAGNDFSLNSTAGAGAAARAAGFPSTFPRGTTANYLDIGAAQVQASAAAGTRVY